MYGRDPQFTFEWNGNSVQYANLAHLIQTPGWNILQWQIVIRPCRDLRVEGMDKQEVTRAKW